MKMLLSLLTALTLTFGLAGGRAEAQTAPAGGSQIGRDITFDSPSLGGPMQFSIYLPPGYDAASAKRYPVIYLLHGHGGNHHAFLDLGNLQATADRMIADGRLPASIIVMPYARNSWYVDSTVRGSGLWGTAIVDDLREHVDANWRTIPRREGRAIAGLSMGGYGALRLALLEPEEFIAAGSLSGALFPDVKAATDFPPFQIALFGSSFGASFDPASFNAASPWRSIKAPVKDVPELYMSVGDKDIAILAAGNDLFHKALMTAGIDVEYRVVPGGHNWTLWSAQLPPLFAFLGEHLGARASVVEKKAPEGEPVAQAKKDGAAKSPEAALVAPTPRQPVVPKPVVARP